MREELACVTLARPTMTMGYRLGYKRGVPERPWASLPKRAELGIMRVCTAAYPHRTLYLRPRNAAGVEVNHP
jgi:hypothetical protein